MKTTRFAITAAHDSRFDIAKPVERRKPRTQEHIANIFATFDSAARRFCEPDAAPLTPIRTAAADIIRFLTYTRLCALTANEWDTTDDNVISQRESRLVIPHWATRAYGAITRSEVFRLFVLSCYCYFFFSSARTHEIAVHANGTRRDELQRFAVLLFLTTTDRFFLFFYLSHSPTSNVSGRRRVFKQYVYGVRVINCFFFFT